MFKVRRVAGDSMLPTLRPGQLVVVIRRRPRVGDVVMIRHDGLEKVKRLTAKRNDTIYVEGDNTFASTDSRVFGWLPEQVIKGTIVWPRKTKRYSYQK